MIIKLIEWEARGALTVDEEVALVEAEVRLECGKEHNMSEDEEEHQYGAAEPLFEEI